LIKIISFNVTFEASTDILFKRVKKLFPCLDPLLIPMFREHYSLFHQGEKQPDTELLLSRILYIYIYIYICCSVEGGKRAGYKGKKERKRIIRIVVILIFFFKVDQLVNSL